ncbi:MAG: YceI family protein [Silvibacterium sp.]|nr:YceI family protein [Silvibacterium sp.]
MKPLATRLLLYAALLIVPVAVAQSTPQAITMHLDPSLSEIHWTLNGNTHTVHGTFRLKGGLITFDPSTGAAQGEIAVDAQTGESGNHSRDSRMHKEIIESDKYPQIIFHPEKVTGVVKPGSTESVTVDGTFTMHGKDHPMRLEAKVQVDGHEAVATTHFTVPYVDWGMKDPSNFLLRVDKTVDVDATARGRIEGAGGRE